MRAGAGIANIEGAGRLRLLSRFLTGSLVAALVALMPLAHASPPDPSWIAGFYDAADHDEVVLAVTDALGYPVSSGSLLVPAQRSREHIVAPSGTTVPSSSAPAPTWGQFPSGIRTRV